MVSSSSRASRASTRSHPPFDHADMRSVSCRFPGRILYYGFALRPDRRGGSAWWSVGLIGFRRDSTATLLRDPEVTGSNPVPDTPLEGPSSDSAPWAPIVRFREYIFNLTLFSAGA